MFLDKLISQATPKKEIDITFFVQEESVSVFMYGQSVKNNAKPLLQSHTYMQSLSRDISDIFPKIAQDINLNIYAIKNCTIYIGVPHSLSEVRIVEYSQSKEFVYTEKIARDILLRDQNTYKDTIGPEFTFIEQKALATALKGYSQNGAYGARTTQVSVQTLISYGKKEFIKKLQDSCEVNFHPKVVLLKTHVWSLYESYLKKEDSKKECFILDIDENHSTIIRIRDKIIKSIYIVAVGKRALRECISTHLKMRSEEIEYFLSKERIDISLADTHTPLSKAYSAWFSLYSDIFSYDALHEHLYLPSDMYVSHLGQDPLLLSVLKSFINTDTYFDSQFTSSPFTLYQLE